MQVSSNIPGVDDAALMAAVAEGSNTALASLYNRYGESAHRIAYRITGSAADAEDVVHDVFVGLPDAARRYAEKGRLAGWLKTLVLRTALLRLRRRSAYDKALLDYVSGDWITRQPDPVDLLAMRTALKAMPEKLRLVFMLKEVEGYDHTEIADLLAIRVAASRVRLHRAWAFLRSRMGVL